MTVRIGDTGADGAPAITAVAALADDLRRRLYGVIRDARRPVSRDEAAGAVGISRKLAAFHLDKLVGAGLLRARYEAVGGIRRVGRTPKVYEPTDEDIRVTIPARRPELLADILLDAVLTEGDDGRARERAIQVATRRGTELGIATHDQTGQGRPGAEGALAVAEQTLATTGFEPVRDTPMCIRLCNCPFHPLAGKDPGLVCGINHAFLSGFLTGLGVDDVQAVLVPRPGQCCVELREYQPADGYER